ncbi:MAG: hypothetical protein WC196_06615 [Bacilli bacterium]
MSNYSSKHGMARTRLYGIWCHMIQRCGNPNNSRFKDYGGRGIIVCDEWKEFTLFMEWSLANGYNDTLTIDRKDNNGNYEPDNCRWATNQEQCNNMSKTVYIEIDGIVDTFLGWSQRTGLPRTTLTSRYYQRKLRGKMLIEPIDKSKVRIRR